MMFNATKGERDEMNRHHEEKDKTHEEKETRLLA